MIFVAGTMTMNPEIIDDFKAEVAAMVDKVRAEDGCLHYSLLVEDADKGLVNVLEKWRDDDALLVHFATMDYGIFRKILSTYAGYDCESF